MSLSNWTTTLTPPSRKRPKSSLKAGIRVPTSQLVQTMINAEMSRLNPRKIAQRFLKCILQQVGGLTGTVLDDEDEQMPEIASAAAAAKT